MRQRSLEGLFGDGTLALSAAALRLRESMGVPGRGEVRARVAASPGSTELQRFYQLLIEPLRDLLPAQEGSRLIIVPERALFLIPFAALENAAGEPLITRHSISVTPSLQTLALASLRKQPAAGTASVVVGNPLMPTYTPRPGARPMDIPPLPGAEEEAKAIAVLLKGNALTGAAATKRTVLAQSATARYVHLATHGFLDRLTTVAQSGVNPYVREIALFDETADGGVKTPGMLALAPSGGPDNDSGMLSADEIAQSSTTAELVVMSACDSGRGAINDDGVIGLSRAWMAAGAPSVMVTLWTIPDDATKDLMVAFYQQLVAGTRKAEALRHAILATRKKYPDPFNWAAFMLIGEPD
jgi:CHAT domain-containing protein